MSFLKETRQLKASDERLSVIIDKVGKCTLSKQENYFYSLCDAIISQQLSLKAAEIIFNRFLALLEGNELNPQNVIKIKQEDLRSVGCSNAKAKYVLSLAESCISKKVDLDKINKKDDEEVIMELTQVSGIGRWTAEMFLIFTLNRLNVLPVDDLGIKKGFMKVYNLPQMPSKSQMIEIAEDWQPYRTIGSWYLWRSLELK